MKRKGVSVLLVLSMVTSLMVGCGEKERKESSITVLVESGSPAEALANNTAEAFENETGCKVIVDAVPYSGMYEKLSTEIKAGSGAHDVAGVPFSTLTALSHGFEPIADADTSDFLPMLEECGMVDGKLIGYPMWNNTKILIYRKDLIPENEVPRTWEEYQAMAEKLATPDMYGASVFGAGMDGLLSYLDFVCQAGAEGLVFDKDGNVNITEQPYIDAMEYMVKLANADYTPADTLAISATESQELFTNGKIAMQLNWGHQYPAALEAMGAEKVGCAPMIGGKAGIGATMGPWYECVMKNSENKDMARKYVEYMYDHNGEYMDLTLRIAGRTSVYEEAAKKPGNEHTTAILETLAAPQTQAFPMIETWKQIQDILTKTVESCLAGADIEESLAAAKTEIEAIK